MTGEKYITVPFVSSGFAIIWGLFAAWPNNHLFAKNLFIYERMQEIAGETFWGCLMIAAGVTALVLYAKEFYKTQSGLLGAVFTLFAVLYAFADMSSPAWAVYSFFALCNYSMLWARIWHS